MPVVRRASVNPFADPLYFVGRQFMPGIFWRHDIVDVIGGDSRKQFAPHPIPWHDGGRAFALGESAFTNIQAQVGLAGIFILPVTGKTISG
jgi:hypothetical protein